MQTEKVLLTLSWTKIIELGSNTFCLLSISSDNIKMCEDIQADLDEELKAEKCKYGEVDISVAEWPGLQKLSHCSGGSR